MLPNNGKPDSWRKTLKLISRCPVCNHDYQSEAAKLFASGGEAKFVHFTCGNCSSHFMAMVMTVAKGVSTVGMITDLSFDDLQKLHKISPLSIDEAIEGHQFINSSDFHLGLTGKKSV
ncbi:MAG: hypothetical protein A2534_03430 [Candidatus Magasanikbacteria bacterium RIFOXYD2_FULL_39_9]|uniref:Uncharacterized protein n=1 Tax=Candidatus Magasanikbacteria bacterium RIFOXYD1_FULL_40_23 TaxID=1798705 RepID=A0A1F6P815_9BACT|nr:MAG: hypothetical protein A2563_04965 [Candidatus Magasanikbacteria bacterium RIFOXYD1_FULL_40_23]OGH92978.1 MAG: hypothetical protein A2534_03430 [Candidatus Magasanikbacteria bacterium RIFOXYD2_FULL_39_9]